MRWIDVATFLLPNATVPVASSPVNNSPEAKCRVPTVHGGHDQTPGHRTRRQAITSDPHAVPVAIGGSGKRKPGARVPPVTAGHEQPAGLTACKKAIRTGDGTGSDGGPSVRMGRYKLADACRLQGLPEDFLADAPFTAEGKLKAVANGVPLPLGRAIARAVREAQGGDR